MSDNKNNENNENNENKRNPGTKPEYTGYVFDFGATENRNNYRPVNENGGNSFGKNVQSDSGNNPKPKKKKNAKKIWKAIGCVMGAAIIFAGGYGVRGLTIDPEVKSLLWLKGQIQKNYYYDDKINQEITDDIFYSAVFDGVNNLLDPYSEYLTYEDLLAMIQESTGEWSGLGVAFSAAAIEDGEMLIVSVSGNSPAEREGIGAGTYIVGFGETEESLVYSGNYNEFSAFLEDYGAGEQFTLALRSGKDGEMEFKQIAKETFVENYVFYRSSSTAYVFTGNDATTLTESDDVLSALDADTAYIRLTQFNGQAATEFAIAMDKFKEEGRKNLILDLRSNGGGYMNILCEIARYFCKDSNAKNPAVATAEYKSGKKQTFYTERDQDKKYSGNEYHNYFSDDSRICVLADNGTASASECLIGCMMDYGAIGYDDICLSYRGGEAKTYGKGIMQSTAVQSPIGKTDAVKLTMARIVWPKTGNCIHQRGVLPEDGAVTVAENYEKDAEILAAIEALGV